MKKFIALGFAMTMFAATMTAATTTAANNKGKANNVVTVAQCQHPGHHAPAVPGVHHDNRTGTMCPACRRRAEEHRRMEERRIREMHARQHKHCKCMVCKPKQHKDVPTHGYDTRGGAVMSGRR